MQSWTDYQLRFKTESWCITEYYMPKSDDYILHNKIILILFFCIYWFKIMIQDNETEILKPHYIHVYKVFG